MYELLEQQKKLRIWIFIITVMNVMHFIYKTTKLSKIYIPRVYLFNTIYSYILNIIIYLFSLTKNVWE